MLLLDTLRVMSMVQLRIGASVWATASDRADLPLRPEAMHMSGKSPTVRLASNGAVRKIIC